LGVPEPVRIVREPDLPRITAAARAIVAEMIRPQPSGMWTPEFLAPSFASRALAADDDHGRGHGVVVQADGLSWDEVDALAELTLPGRTSPRCARALCDPILLLGGRPRPSSAQPPPSAGL
jgi:hypothetical protein